jgi:phosphoglycerol transferase MdoB-like AlkP superfamily enzyme
MYSRINWYRQAQFNETWFREQLEKQGLPLCGGAFTGICDEPISNWIGNRLSQNRKVPQFIYWVTLNSHLPVPIPNDLSGAPSCSMVKGLLESPEICSWYQLIYNVHRSISQLALREKSGSTIFVIVGDHVPPFSSTQLRGQFSDEVVPYVVLLPKKVEAKLAQLQMIAPSPGPTWAKIRQHPPKKRQASSKT